MKSFTDTYFNLYKKGKWIKRFVPKFIRQKIKNRVNKKILEQIKRDGIPSFQIQRNPSGINLIGFFSMNVGLGESARILAKEIQKTDYPLATIDFDPTSYTLTTIDSCKYNINIMNIVPAQTLPLLQQSSLFPYHYNIGFFLWETEQIPKEWLPYLDYYDEIWTPSEFCSNSFRKKFQKPVITIPYSSYIEVNQKYNRKYFHLPKDTFIFFMSYDTRSVSERKNPKGTIEAFQKSFEPNNHDVMLLIKVNHAFQKELKTLRKWIGAYSNISIMTNDLTKIEMNSLVNCVDVVCSLHRAEGFGLVLAEAMLLKKPTIATSYSGNLQFMDKDSSCLVSYDLVNIKKNIFLYKKNDKWANPDINEAAHYMKKLYIDKNYYQKIANAGYKHIQKVCSIDSIVHQINDRIETIYKHYEE